MKHKKKLTLDDIFNEVDELGLLELKEPKSSIKTEEDRLIDSFEAINTFYQENDREPGRDSMSEYSLASRLSNFRKDEEQKKTLKPFDRYNLLGEVEIELASMDDILDELDDMLEVDDDLSIFEYKHIPQEEERAEADFVARRKPMSEKEFRPYEKMFLKVHEEIKEGKRKLVSFSHAETNLIPGNFYVMDGLLLYLESADLKREEWEQKSGNRIRLEGRTRTIFENGTCSNMLFRSLGKQILANGKMVTNSDESIEHKLFVDAKLLNEEDVKTGWIYVLKSKSTHPNIASIKNLYKIGTTAVSVDERIKNAANEATYLYAEVHKVAAYTLYNRNVDKLEELIHRFFAEVCLDIDVEVVKGKRVSPREWFVAPFEEIDKAIELILTEKIIDYKYDKELERIVRK